VHFQQNLHSHPFEQYCSCLLVCKVARWCHWVVQVATQTLHFAMLVLHLGIYSILIDQKIILFSWHDTLL
jgi:hypothetical protein